MKIVFFAPFYYPHLGGLESYVKELAELLTKKGNEVWVLTSNIPKNKYREEIAGVKILRVPSFEIVPNYPVANLFSKKFWEIWREIRAAKVKAIVSNTRFFLTSVMAMCLAKKSGSKFLHIEHGSSFVESGSLFTKFMAWLVDQSLGRMVLKSSQVNIGVSKKVAEFVSKFDSRKVEIVYRGIDDKLLDGKRITRKKDEKINILYVGRLINGKGLLDLIESLSNIDEDYVCEIVGQGPQKTLLEERIKSEGSEKKIKILGQLSHEKVLEKMWQADIFVNPSYTEGLPTTIIEAVYCGCYVIATDVGGTSEVLADYNRKELVEARNVEMLSRAIKNGIREVKSGQNVSSGKDSLKKFSWEESVKKLEELINA